MFKPVTTTLAALALLVMPIAANAAAPEIGAAAPDFETTDIHGETFKLSDHKGKIVVLEWSNHQCPFVMKHYDSGNMQSTQAVAKEQGVEWITIVSSGEGKQGNTTPEEAAQILKDKGATVTTKILDPSGEIGHLYDAKTTPHMFIVDTDGTLVYEGAIDSDASPNPATIEGAENYVLSALEDLKAGNAVRTAQSSPYGCGVKYTK